MWQVRASFPEDTDRPADFRDDDVETFILPAEAYVHVSALREVAKGVWLNIW